MRSFTAWREAQDTAQAPTIGYSPGQASTPNNWSNKTAVNQAVDPVISQSVTTLNNIWHQLSDVFKKVRDQQQVALNTIRDQLSDIFKKVRDQQAAFGNDTHARAAFEENLMTSINSVGKAHAAFEENLMTSINALGKAHALLRPSAG